MYFAYCINPESDRPILFIDKQIGSNNDGIGVVGEQFAAELLGLDEMGKSSCEIRINSIGGSVKDMMSIYSAMLKTKMKVDTFCTGIACSSAAVLFMAGRNRVMADYSAAMIHNPYDPEDPEAKKDTGLEIFCNSICSMISTRTGGKLSPEQVTEMMNKTTWFFADPSCSETPENVLSAIEYGIATEIEYSDDMNKPRISIASAKNSWKEALNFVNSIKETDMKNVCNKLGLVENSKEELILTAIQKIQDKADKMEDSIENKSDGFKKKLEDAENAVTAANAAKETAENALAALKKEVTDAKDAADAQAKTDLSGKVDKMIDAAVKAGKIKNDEKSIGAWKSQAIANYDGTVDTLNAISVNKTGIDLNNLPAEVQNTAVVGETNAAYRMAQINAKKKK